MDISLIETNHLILHGQHHPSVEFFWNLFPLTLLPFWTPVRWLLNLVFFFVYWLFIPFQVLWNIVPETLALSTIYIGTWLSWNFQLKAYSINQISDCGYLNKSLEYAFIPPIVLFNFFTFPSQFLWFIFHGIISSVLLNEYPAECLDNVFGNGYERKT